MLTNAVFNVQSFRISVKSTCVADVECPLEIAIDTPAKDNVNVFDGIVSLIIVLSDYAFIESNHQVRLSGISDVLVSKAFVLQYFKVKFALRHIKSMQKPSSFADTFDIG
jgi:hypothetical protein